MARDQTASRSVRTLWVWPGGIFPRRVAYYVKAKSVTADHLNRLGLTLIPCTVDLKSQDLALDAIPGYEKRPKGFSLPVLRIQDLESSNHSKFIAQSSSILEYLEDLLPASDGHPSLRGDDAFQAARVRDIVQLINEVLTWCNVHVRHLTAFSLGWSGMTEEQQSPQAGEDAQVQYRRLLTTLQSWTNTCSKGVSLVGADRPTLADITAAAAKTSMEDLYGINLFDGFEGLEAWWTRYQSSPWFVIRDVIDQIEKDGFNLLLK
ncbi:hypothetical protein AYO21_09772 [Fonsecaea monophora]|uniref:Uncharacterized protein n=1 Tax=Fonsecaea monophora TaxID=254056 RepID=A0A177EVJ3_9EURO|nr:hypothetical protein AYO21_09772 [Fonsecaea monophora]OAG36054.1 hypothetical protein AYO21_09772 [Fonsecaea monophora]